MAANCVRKAVQSTSGSAKTLLARSSSSPLTFKACKFSGISSVRTTPSRLSVQKLFPFRIRYTAVTSFVHHFYGRRMNRI